MSASFTARFPGECGHCFEPIEAGEEVVFVPAPGEKQDDLVHVMCPPILSDTKDIACSECHLVHAGGCW